jgi:hypothetical protein
VGARTFSTAQAWRHAVGAPLSSNVRRHKSSSWASAQFSQRRRFAFKAVRGHVRHKRRAFALLRLPARQFCKASQKLPQLVLSRPGTLCPRALTQDFGCQAPLGSVRASTAKNSKHKISVWSSNPRPTSVRCWACVGQAPMCRLTIRSRGGPTAGHQGPVGGTVYIFANRALASRRRPPLSSNVSRHRRQPGRPTVDNTYSSLIMHE